MTTARKLPVVFLAALCTLAGPTLYNSWGEYKFKKWSPDIAALPPPTHSWDNVAINGFLKRHVSLGDSEEVLVNLLRSQNFDFDSQFSDFKRMSLHRVGIGVCGTSYSVIWKVTGSTINEFRGHGSLSCL